jgi:hypothetical protein
LGWPAEGLAAATPTYALWNAEPELTIITETRDQEWDYAAEFGRLLAFVSNFDFAPLWGPDPPQTYHWLYQINRFGGKPIAANGFGFAGTELFGRDWDIWPDDIPAALSSIGALPFDGNIYPVGDSSVPWSTGTDEVVYGSDLDLEPSDEFPHYIYATRSQVRAKSRCVYTIFEYTEVCDPTAPFPYMSGVCRLVSTGTARVNDIIPIPMPAHAVPFLAIGPWGQEAVVWLATCIVFNQTLDEYVDSIDGYRVDAW